MKWGFPDNLLFPGTISGKTRFLLSCPKQDFLAVIKPPDKSKKLDVTSKKKYLLKPTIRLTNHLFLFITSSVKCDAMEGS
ncbi:hypothetical protein NIES3974_08440 [Calothrix sp. NIES-3974]|nr:hypothetical protein NIES3974_08440 [Calothrix sp. NIES-3974]